MFDHFFLICKLYRQFILISDYGKWHLSYLYRFPLLYSSSQNNYYNFRSKSKISLQIFIKYSFCFISTTCFFKENIFYIFFMTNSTNGSVRKDMKMVFEIWVLSTNSSFHVISTRYMLEIFALVFVLKFLQSGDTALVADRNFFLQLPCFLWEEMRYFEF